MKIENDLGFCFYVVVVLLLSPIQLFGDSMDYSPPGSSVHRISQARVLEWAVTSFFRDLPRSGIEPVSSAFAGGFSTTEPPGKTRCTEYFQCPTSPLHSIYFPMADTEDLVTSNSYHRCSKIYFYFSKC